MAVVKILLVDDSQTTLATERAILVRGGYEVITARSADEGRRLAIAERPDLMLVDANLPAVSGLEACRQLAADPRTAAIPVVLMQPAWLAEPAGAPAWLAVASKPVVEPELLFAVRGVVGDA